MQRGVAYHDFPVCAVIVCQWVVGVRILVQNDCVRYGISQGLCDAYTTVRRCDEQITERRTDMAFRAVPPTKSALPQDEVIPKAYAASVLSDQLVTIKKIECGEAYGVRTISAPSALNMTSFSKLILAGKVMIHAYPFSAQAIARPIPM